MQVQFNLTDGTSTYINSEYVYKLASPAQGQTDLYLDTSMTEVVVRVFGHIDYVASKLNWKW